MKRTMGYIFTSLLIVTVATGFFLSRNWNSTTALFPQAVCIPLLALLVAILVVDIRQGRSQKTAGKAAAEAGGEGEEAFVTLTGKTTKYFVWLVSFGVLIWAIGMMYAIPIYVFSYLKFVGKYSWLKSGLYAVGAVAVIYVVFEYAFNVAWPEGALQSLFNT